MLSCKYHKNFNRSFNRGKLQYGRNCYFFTCAANSVTWEDSNLATKVGEQYTVEQALYGLLLYSANEIAYGLAEHVGGSLENFVEMMNARARELGAVNTHFANASGLYDPNIIQRLTIWQ